MLKALALEGHRTNRFATWLKCYANYWPNHYWQHHPSLLWNALRPVRRWTYVARRLTALSRARTIALVVGTRPEAIKLAPVILALLRRGTGVRPLVISTGQHGELAASALAAFGLAPEIELPCPKTQLGLAGQTAQYLEGLSRLLGRIGPELVVVQGDTTSALAGALAAFYHRTPLAYVEAGLRTGDLAEPFPEEANRQLISRVACLQFAPTNRAKANLLAEGIPPELIRVTGNTVVDALELLRDQVTVAQLPLQLPKDRKLILVTAHRRENLGRPLEAICESLCRLTELRPELHCVFLTHPNPAANQAVRARLAQQDGITLLGPLPYVETLALAASAWLVMTDSGGLQEEAPSLGRPLLVLRNRTERVEGRGRLVGTDTQKIVGEVLSLLDDPVRYQRLLPRSNPYGDGRASWRIVNAMFKLLEPPLARKNTGTRGRSRLDMSTRV